MPSEPYTTDILGGCLTGPRLIQWRWCWARDGGDSDCGCAVHGGIEGAAEAHGGAKGCSEAARPATGVMGEGRQRLTSVSYDLATRRPTEAQVHLECPMERMIVWMNKSL